MKNINILKSFLLFVTLHISIFFFYNIQSSVSYLKSAIEFKKNDYYIKKFNKKRDKIDIYYNNNNPYISIISPIYNREQYLFKFIQSIQNQKFYNLEIIFIDDKSFDNSVKIISKLRNVDKRIILIKNNKNKGTLISRNLGILFSKGKYIIIPDPDDIITKNILNICYKLAEKYNFEIIRFNCYLGKGKMNRAKLIKALYNKPIYQPELKSYLYYGTGEIKRIDGFIHNKFIKKEVFIKALNLIQNFYLNIHMIFLEDVLIIHAVYIVADSFFFIRTIGYFYSKNAKSITNHLTDNLKIKAFLLHLKFFLIFTKIINMKGI